jgi:hypothetical protein
MVRDRLAGSHPDIALKYIDSRVCGEMELVSVVRGAVQDAGDWHR